MRHIRMVGLALVAVFATAAVAATSASASLPEFGECVVQGKHEGKYTNAGCTTKAKKVNEKFTGEFEWRKATEIAEKTIAGDSGPGVLKTVLTICQSAENLKECREGETKEELAVSVECSAQENAGEITGTKELKNVVVKFTGCLLFGSAVCQNSIEAGEIKVNPLRGKLGFINKTATPRQVGVLLEPATKGGEFAKFNCAEFLETHVGAAKETEFPFYPPKGGGDGIISPVTPVNTMTEAFTQTYTVSEKDENIPSKFEGTQPLKVLEDWIENAREVSRRSKWSPAGEELTNTEADCTASGFNRPECIHRLPGGTKPGEIKAN
jgi:hypothetical protein